MTVKDFTALLKRAFHEWREDNAPRLAAALSFYSLFALAPLLIIAVSITGLVFGREAAEGRIVDQIGHVVGRDAAKAVEDLIESARNPESSIGAGALGIIAMFIGASGLFGQIQDALNTIWEVEPKRTKGVIKAICYRALSIAMVFGTVLLLLAALIANAALAVLSSLVHVRITVFVVSVAVLTLLFALLFKILPNAAIRWRDVWVGAAFTALLFVLGKFLFGVYLGRAGAVSAYGAASSLVIVLLWIYYSAQVLLFGAEFTQVYAHRSRDTQLEGTSHHPGPALTKGSACSSLGHF